MTIIMGEFNVTRSDVQLRRDLIGQGWRDRDIARAVAMGDLTKIRYGAYIPTEMLPDLDALGWARLRSRAVLRTATPTAVLSHQSALAEFEVPMWGLDLDTTHVTRTDGRAGRREAGVNQHRGILLPGDWSVRADVPVMNLARAVLEVIVSSTLEVGLVTACSALSSGRLSESDLATVQESTQRWPNSLTLRLVLARADNRLTSIGEARTWHFFHAQRVPLPEPQVEVRDERGNLLGIVDFLWRGHGVFLEFDGRMKYDLFRRAGESLEQYLMREKRREELICQVTGWVCIRLQWQDLASPAQTATRILRVLESRLPAA